MMAMKASLLFALSGFLVKNTVASAQDGQDAPLLLSKDQAYVYVAVACGDPLSSGCGDEDFDKAVIHEKHEVRCCSDTQQTKNDWVYNTEYGCSVWGGSYLFGPDSSNAICHHDATYEEAVAICKANNARVCSKGEIMSRCTKGSGCNHDFDMIWTSDIAEPPAPTVSAAPSPVPEQDIPLLMSQDDPSVYVALVCGDKGRCGGDYELNSAHLSERHEVRCCSDEKIALHGWRKNSVYGCSVWGGSFMVAPDGSGGAVCHHDATYAEAVDICKANGARLCTQGEVFNRCTMNSGCLHDHDMIWTSTLAIPEPTVSTSPSYAPLPDDTYFNLVCGRRSHSSCKEKTMSVAPIMQKHEVRCCSDFSLPGWRKNPGCNVWAQSELYSGKCFHGSTYEEARGICEANGGRLCSKDEVWDGCTGFSGCGHDADLVWTSTIAPGSEVQAYLNSVRAASSIESVCSDGFTGSVRGDPHVVTFDGLKYDCQGRGEFVMAMSKVSDPLKIHGRFVDDNRYKMRPSVTRSVAIKVDENVPVIHLTVPDKADENGLCPISYSIGPNESPIPVDQVGTYFSKYYSGKVNVYAATNHVNTVLVFPDKGAKIRVVTKKGRYDCVMGTSVCLTPSMHGGADNIVGLMGSPNGKVNDDWMSALPGGANTPIPSGKWNIRKEGHQYCMANWCIGDASASLYRSDTFNTYNKCPENYFDPDAFMKLIENIDPVVLANCEQNTENPEECAVDAAVVVDTTGEDPVTVVEEIVQEIVEEEAEMKIMEELTEVDVIERADEWESSTTVFTDAPTPVPEESDLGNDNQIVRPADCDENGRRLQRQLQQLQEEGPTCKATRNSQIDYEGDFLMQKWGITEPSFNYNDLIFALCYGVSDMMSDTMPNYQIYTNDCETPVTEGVLNVVQTVYGDSHDPSGGLGDRTQELKLALDPAILLKSNIYADPVDAKAEVEFCVRNQLFIESGPEVNFLETIVTLTIDLRGCFEITGVSATPADRTDEEASEQFELRGYMCDETNQEKDFAEQIFVQGSIIRVCVTPDDKSRNANLFMRHINDFSWTLRERPSVVQPAIVGPNQAAPIGLTSVECTPGDLICAFDTFLRADFYTGTGTVDGAGSAVMQFGNNIISRRLGDGSRGLQASDATAPGSDEQVASTFKLTEVSLITGEDRFRRSGSTRAKVTISSLVCAVLSGAAYLLS